MTGINALIRYVHANGWGRAIYDGAFPVIVVAVLTLFLIYRKKYDLPLWKTIVFAGLMIYLITLVSPFLVWVENGFRSRSGANILRVFVYLPLICLLLAKSLRMKPGKMLDLAAPAILLWHLIGQSVCPFLGCCRGIPCKWGIWNPKYDEIVFPTQWLICLSVLIILVYILYYLKKKQYCGSGEAYPRMLILVGCSRFFLEFLKGEAPVFVGITGLGYHALFMAFVGTAWLFALQEIAKEKDNLRTVQSEKQRKGPSKEETK